MTNDVQRFVHVLQTARRHVLTLGSFALAVSACVAARRVHPPLNTSVHCTGKDSYLQVRSDVHGLAQCEAGVATTVYRIRLGHGGLGKTAAGDGKTPRGTYALGPPRASMKFGTFVPIHYPTPSEVARGYTGSALGLHGPHRSMRWAGRFVNIVDSTDGCVGLASDVEMASLAEWLTRHPGARIVIE